LEYTLLNGGDQRNIRMSHVRDLEATHYRLSLEESEEPGSNPTRTAMLADIERRVAAHRAVLEPAGDAVPVGEDGKESPEVPGKM